MDQLATDFTFETQENGADDNVINLFELRLIEGPDQTSYIYYRNQLLAQYQKNDNYARNIIIVQLFLCHNVSQKMLSNVFQLTIPHISTLVCKYRKTGSKGIEDRVSVRIGNNQKIKGKIAEEIVKQLNVAKENRPTYIAVVKHIKKKFDVQLSPQRISCWWRTVELEKRTQQNTINTPKQMTLPVEGSIQVSTDENLEQNLNNCAESTPTEESEANGEDSDNIEGKPNIGEEWQPNIIAGCFILYAMLNASQFLKPFIDNLKEVVTTSSKAVERVMLTLFFTHALRLKSIEQTKHLLAAHFGPLVLGSFCRLQSLRYAIDNITEQKEFDKAVTEHYQSMSQYTELGDDIY